MVKPAPGMSVFFPYAWAWLGGADESGMSETVNPRRIAAEDGGLVGGGEVREQYAGHLEPGWVGGR